MADEPWAKWFWADYDADQGLRMCSLAAQGLWMRMLCIMARADPVGELIIGTEQVSVDDLARSVGEIPDVVASLIGELDRRGVFSRTLDGTIYNRRMLKNRQISAKRSFAGKKGAASTNLKRNDNSEQSRQNSGKALGKTPALEARSQKLEARKLEGKQEPTLPLEPEPSNLKARESEKSAKRKKVCGIEIPDWIPDDAWDGFAEMRKTIRKPLTARAVTLTINNLERLRAKGYDPGALLDQSTLKSWTGVFEPGDHERHQFLSKKVPGAVPFHERPQ